MVERELPTKFDLGPSSGFRETLVYGRTTARTDACATTVTLMTKSSRAKTERAPKPHSLAMKTYIKHREI